MKVALDEQRKIGGLLLVPHVEDSVPARGKQETELSLPFQGAWPTIWGGAGSQHKAEYSPVKGDVISAGQ